MKVLINSPITASFTFDQIEPVLTGGVVAAYSITLTEEDNRTVLTKKLIYNP